MGLVHSRAILRCFFATLLAFTLGAALVMTDGVDKSIDPPLYRLGKVFLVG